MAATIAMENITKTYQLGEITVPVLKDINLSIAEGEYVAIMGASGSGKSTLMLHPAQRWGSKHDRFILPNDGTPNTIELLFTCRCGWVKHLDMKL